jgi:hypothetical protein
VPPPIGQHATAVVHNPSGNPCNVLLRLSALDVVSSEQLLLGRGQTEAVVHFELKKPIEDGGRIFITALDRSGRTVLRTQSMRWRPTTPIARGDDWETVMDGNDQVKAYAHWFPASLAPGATEPAPPQPAMEKQIELHYQFADGWRFAMLRPPGDQREIEGKPKMLGMWAHGDGSGNVLRSRFVDATGQTFQPDYGVIDWTGWKWIAMPLDGTSAGHWGGANDGVIHYPIAWDSVALVDNMNLKINEPLLLRFAGFAVGYE